VAPIARFDFRNMTGIWPECRGTTDCTSLRDSAGLLLAGWIETKENCESVVVEGKRTCKPKTSVGCAAE